jgi:hypothetical protein
MDRTHITTMENIDAMVFVFVLLAGMLKKWGNYAAAWACAANVTGR